MKNLSLFLCLSISVAQAQHWINPQPTGQGLEGITSMPWPYVSHEGMGRDVAISGDFAVSTATGHKYDASGANAISNAGAVFVYKKTAGVWAFYQKLVASDRYQSLGFGSCVAIDGNYMIVGSYSSTDINGNNLLYGSGALYVFKLVGGVWTEQQKLVVNDRRENDNFAWSCAIDSNVLVAGGHNGSYNANGQDSLYHAGAVYVFAESGGVWTQQQKIVPQDRAAESVFGLSVAISGNRIICGASGQQVDENGNYPIFEAGAAYIFKRTGTVWSQEQKLVNIDRSYRGWFGGAVDIEGDYAAITATGNVTDANYQNPIANMGAAYVFVRTPNGWVQHSKLVPSDRNASSLFFGNNISISGSYVLVGHAQDDANYNRSGSAYLYMKKANSWEQLQKLTAYFSMEDYFFGSALEIDGANIIVGEPGFSDVGNYVNVGDIYLFNAAPLSISTQAVQASCQSAADGAVKVTVTGGLAPFAVSNGTETLSGSGTFYGLGSGSYTINATDALNATATQSVSVGQAAGVCAGSLLLQADSVADYLDTITVRVSLADADNLFSVYAKLHFDSSMLALVDYTEEEFFGTTNIVTTPPVITGGVIDFGVSKTSGQAGTNGNGAFYTFRFVPVRLPANVPFYYQNPESIATLFSLNSITVYDAVGAQRKMETPAPAATLLRYYVPVWPGDLNCDYKVNVADILPIGYFYNLHGPTRPNAGLQWMAQEAPIWGFECEFRNSSAYQTFADGNGNGLIDLADQSAIGFNLNKIHALPPVWQQPDESRGGNEPPITVEISPDVLDSTQLPATLSIPVRIGSSNQPVSNLYGVAFDLLFDAAYVDTNNIQLDYSNTVFGTQNVDYIRIEDLHKGEGRLSIGFTRFNTTEVYAAGDELLTVTLTIKAQVPRNWFRFTAVPLDANNLAGEDIYLSSMRDSVYIMTSIPSGIANAEGFRAPVVYPNPAGSGSCVVQWTDIPAEPEHISLLATDGKEVLRYEVAALQRSGKQITLPLHGLSDGLYVVKMSLRNGQSTISRLSVMRQ